MVHEEGAAPWGQGAEENYAKITLRRPCAVPFGIPGLLSAAYDLLGDYLTNGMPDPDNEGQRLPKGAGPLPVTDWGHRDSLNMNYRCRRVGHNACAARGSAALTHMGIRWALAADATEYGDDCVR